MLFRKTFAFLTLLLATSPLVAADVPIPLINASFEEAVPGALPRPAGWQSSVGYPNTYDVTEHDAVGAKDGKFALLCSTSVDYAAVSQLTQTPITPGATYTLSAKFLSRVSRDAQSGGFLLRLLVRNAANPAEAFIVANSYGPPDALNPGEWVSQKVSWTAPAVLTDVPIISNGVLGTEPDGTRDLSAPTYHLEVLVGGSFPLKNPDDTTLFQTWVDAVTLTQSASN